jgi:hypothetical protein
VPTTTPVAVIGRDGGNSVVADGTVVSVTVTVGCVRITVVAGIV